MKDTSSHKRTAPGLNLTQLHAHLVHSLGDKAPSLITLKRHAGSGRLLPLSTNSESERSPNAQSLRKLYDAEAALVQYRPLAGEPQIGVFNSESTQRIEELLVQLLSQSAGHSNQPAPIEQASIAISPGQIEEIVQKILVHIAPTLNKAAGLSSLNSTLMLKYDSVTALYQQKAERMEKELQEIRRSSSLDLSMTKILTEISRLNTAVSELRFTIEEK